MRMIYSIPVGANAEKQRARLTFTSFADFDTNLRGEAPIGSAKPTRA